MLVPEIVGRMIHETSAVTVHASAWLALALRTTVESGDWPATAAKTTASGVIEHHQPQHDLAAPVDHHRADPTPRRPTPGRGRGFRVQTVRAARSSTATDEPLPAGSRSLARLCAREDLVGAELAARPGRHARAVGVGRPHAREEQERRDERVDGTHQPVGLEHGESRRCNIEIVDRLIHDGAYRPVPVQFAEAFRLGALLTEQAGAAAEIDRRSVSDAVVPAFTYGAARRRRSGRRRSTSNRR
jgi:hypothetical protein